MSSPDSFVDEVNEDLRRDRLFALMRRYGWIAVLGVLLLVGGAAYREWSAAQARAEAQARGDALRAALAQGDAAAQAEALATQEGVLARLLLAAAQQEAGASEEAQASLQALADDPQVPQVYRDLAVLKSAMSGGAAPLDGLQRLAAGAGPFRLLAAEQVALNALSAGDQDAAIAGLRAIAEDAEATQGLRERAQSLLSALGADAPTEQN